MNNKVINLIRYNIKNFIKNKLFIILNVILFIACIVGLNLTEITTEFNRYFNEKTLEIYDEKNMFYEEIVKEFSSEKNVKINKIDNLEYNKETFENNKIIIQVNYNDVNILNIKTISTKAINKNYYNKIKSVSENVRNRIFMEESSISIDNLNLIKEGANIETIVIEKQEYTMEQEKLFIIAILIPFIGFFLIINSFSKEIFAEKTSKSSEYILTSITSKDYVFMKIGTTICTAIIQSILIVGYFLIAYLIKSIYIENSIIEVLLQNKDIIKIIIIELILFLPYLFIMLIVQMIMSCKADDSSDLDSTTKITLMLATITMLGSFMLIEGINLEGSWIGYNILSWLPMFSTFFIPAIMAYNNIKSIQIIGAIIAYVFTITFLIKKFKISEKIKNGILDYKPQNNKNVNNGQIKKINSNIEQDINQKIYKKQVSKYAILIGFSIILYLILSSMILPITIKPLLISILGHLFSENNLIYIIDIINTIIAMYIPTKIILCFSKNVKIEKSKNKFKAIFIAIPFTALVFSIQTLLTKWITGKTFGTEAITTEVSYMLIFIRLVIVPAIFEEMFFRKAILNASRKFGVGFAIIVSSVLFGLIHLNFYQAIGAMFAGIIFSIVVLKTGSILPTIILHALANGYSFFITILWANNSIYKNLLNIFVIGFSIIGGILALENLLKNKKQLFEDIKNLKDQKNKKRYKIVFTNYYFIVAIILVVICFAITQKTIKLLM